MAITRLRCEYAENPLGIGVATPRLSWVLESRQRDQRQTAYRILVASSEARLDAEEGDLWDSDKVISDRSTQIAYIGKPLASRQRCWWKVCAWDQEGRPSAWSAPALWEMGLLKPEDWQATWIGLEQPWPGQVEWPSARWIWYPEGNPARSAPTNMVVCFRRAFTLPRARTLQRALLRIAADDYFELFVNGQPAGRNWGKPYSCKIIQEIDLQPLLAPGQNLLAVLATNRLDQAGLLAQLVVEFDRGSPFVLQTDQSWLVRKGMMPQWHTSASAGVGWSNALEVARPGEPPWREANYPPMLPAPYLRKEVTLPKPVLQARLYASALGVYEFHINGRRVGADLFNPGWTDYRKRVQYHTYDITRLLRRGDNALGIILGDGWYSGFLGLNGRCRYGTLPLALAQVEIEFTDGSKQTIVTDGSWQASTGPLLQSDMLMGETYDARKEKRGWDEPGFGLRPMDSPHTGESRVWNAVSVRQISAPLVAACDAPVRKTQELRPRRVTQPKPGVFIFDLGQNMVGGVRLKARGPTGDRVTLRFAEMLNPDGTLYVDNLREARCTDHYILAGRGTEIYESHFTFHGFRYVEVTGLPGRPDRNAITGLVFHSDTPRVGSFECSNPLINQLQSNIEWGQRGNFLSIPTDCPQRDERLGWTGDAQVFVRTATGNRDVAAFFTKWCQDVEDAQQPNGAFTDVVPYVAATNGTAAWGDAGVICPWTIYQVYGDTRLLAKHYAAGGRWIDYCLSTCTNYLRPATKYGDWLSINADTPLDLLATACFAQSTRLMAQMATALGKTHDAARYENLFQHIKTAFNRAYVTEDGRIQGDTQTGYLMALEFDLLPPEKRPVAVRRLVEDIRAKGDHLSTGFVGVGLLMPALTRASQVDVAYRLLNQDTFPSWLYSVKNGATTIWERWDGWTKEKGFQTPWMNSFNHYSLGSVGAWLYETVAGIGLDPEHPGFKHLVIRPRPGGGLTWAKAEYDSIHGPIVSDWQLVKGEFRLDLTLPVNTTATVHLPIATPSDIREGRQPVEKAEGVRFLRCEGFTTVLEVGSGRYRFTGPLAR